MTHHWPQLPPTNADDSLLVRCLWVMLAATILILATPVGFAWRALRGEPDDDHIFRDN